MPETDLQPGPGQGKNADLSGDEVRGVRPQLADHHSEGARRLPSAAYSQKNDARHGDQGSENAWENLGKYCEE